ncbi:P-loop containing nucleoside triphosphate hydrolase protein [Coniochaeta ligniaria NRRL 30616]|uniref:p-loop containing nucleoside triphosphate hydrolase protein n=1 Tax=Coniochaeta ligniaria NRRL 30616 TaxID=1408157 RepID=A0A1J7IPV0_9PEZI|nr:P-loop containing nucleoside triphosphate hydrolase protein [Coniochaeta ligniaria NRRL 30616]
MARDQRHASSYDAWHRHSSKQRVDTELAVQDFLSASFPNHHITRTMASACDLLGYASAGFATATPAFDTGFDATRAYSAPKTRLEQDPGKLIDHIKFGRWCYTWQENEYIIYQIQYHDGYGRLIKVFFVLSPTTADDATDGHHAATDGLILAASQWTKDLHDEIYVFDDQMWRKDSKLYLDVKGSSWDDVILDPTMKRNLVQDVLSFFDNSELYRSLKVPWKRGVIFHGVPGNGKTISLQALINSLSQRKDPIPSLYVKSFDGCRGEKYSIQSIFEHARTMAPCLLIFEDLDSLVVDECRSYFLNEVDGLESNDGILMIGSTNHLGRLDPAITKRPSRFDRKYHFRVPNMGERLEYCRYWSRKFTDSTTVDFPDEICDPIAAMTEDFSFAYLKELFVTSLLELARGATGEVADATDGDIGKLDPASKVDEAAKAASTKKAKRVLAEVEIAESVKDNTLLKIVTKQARMLLDEMDSTEEADHEEVSRSFSRPMRNLRATAQFVPTNYFNVGL